MNSTAYFTLAGIVGFETLGFMIYQAYRRWSEAARSSQVDIRLYVIGLSLIGLLITDGLSFQEVTDALATISYSTLFLMATAYLSFLRLRSHGLFGKLARGLSIGFYIIVPLLLAIATVLIGTAIGSTVNESLNKAAVVVSAIAGCLLVLADIFYIVVFFRNMSRFNAIQRVIFMFGVAAVMSNALAFIVYVSSSFEESDDRLFVSRVLYSITYLLLLFMKVGLDHVSTNKGTISLNGLE
jgi:hypothetical protein